MGHVRRGGENGAGGDREEKRGSRELGGLSEGWTAAGWLRPSRRIPCPEHPRRCLRAGEKMHKANIFDVTVNVF